MKDNKFVVGEHYHVFNKGVDDRNIFIDQSDVDRFYQSMIEFNSVKPIGSIYENSFAKKQLGRETSKSERLVKIVAYCLNPNHFHFILEQIKEGGISELMKRLGGGYTKYVNNKIKRRGSLFSGLFNYRHIDNNEYLLHLSAYINLNNKVHGLDKWSNNQLGRETSKLVESKSSWFEYSNPSCLGICDKDIVLDQFDNIEEYKKMAEEKLEDMILRKKELEFD